MRAILRSFALGSSEFKSLEREEIGGTCYEVGLRRLWQGSRGGERRRDANQFHGRAARVEAGGSLRHLRGQDARPGGCKAWSAAEDHDLCLSRLVMPRSFWCIACDFSW